MSIVGIAGFAGGGAVGTSAAVKYGAEQGADTARGAREYGEDGCLLPFVLAIVFPICNPAPMQLDFSGAEFGF